MCGITGIYNYKKKSPVTDSVLEDMLLSINHRGPDERGVYISGNLGLGSVRLSIIDLATGQQPLSDSSGNYWIVFNGEIFNYIELKQELEQKGYHFRTKSDTEVIVAGYAVWGKDFLSKLNGQFAFAIWDKKKQELFLARDRVGICPLYYTNEKGSFIFGSEVKAILKNPMVNPGMNINALLEIFTYWTPLSPSTIFKNIYEVTPGHFVVINANKFYTAPYWKLEFPERRQGSKRSVSSAKEELEEILTDAVRIRLRADVPVAAYLSGGIDSTTTTALIKKIDPDVLNTFSIGFSDRVFDETAYQQEAAKFLNTNHRSIECSSDDISDTLPHVVWHAESPMLRTAPAPMYNLSRFVRQNHIKVVITGEGADEMLAGYDIFKEMMIRRFWARDPDSRYRPLLLKKLYPYIPQMAGANAQSLKFFYGYKLENVDLPYYSHLMRWNNGHQILRYLHPSLQETVRRFDPFENWLQRMPDGFHTWNDLGKAQYIESTLFMSGYLLSSQGDRMTMANSVEGRYPFLDHRFIEFAAKLPEEYKIRGLNEKFILKKMMEDKIPESIRKRPKQAYRAPISSSFFSNPGGGYIDSVFAVKNLEESGIFDARLISRLVEKIKRTGTASEVENMVVMAVLSTQLFCRFFLEGQSPQENFPLSRLHVINENLIKV